MYHVECECQQQIEVHAGQAGSNVTCPCGREVRVPKLSDLRVSAGQGQFESGVTSKIERMVSTGELPHGNECVVSGIPTEDFVEIQVLCERPTHKDDLDEDSHYLPLAFAPLRMIIGIFRLLTLIVSEILRWISETFTQPPAPDPRDMELLNQELVVVQCPLRILASHHESAASAGSRKLKSWLKTVPVYDELFERYPRALCRFVKGVEA